MGDVEEGEIIDADYVVPISRPAIQHERGTPEMIENFRGPPGFWSDRQMIKSFDYNHGRWHDRWSAPGADCRDQRLERQSMTVEYDRPDGRKIETFKQMNYKGERPNLDVPMPEPSHTRLQYFGRKSYVPTRHGIARDRFRNRRSLTGNGSSNFRDFRRPTLVQKRRLDDCSQFHATMAGKEDEITRRQDMNPLQGRPNYLQSEKDNRYMARLDKSREESVILSEIRQKSFPKEKEVRGDEYDLDDYQLLLERHKLIQQQLTAIGVQETNLQKMIVKNALNDEFSDFVVVPNPNSPLDSVFSDISRNLHASTGKKKEDFSDESKVGHLTDEVDGIAESRADECVTPSISDNYQSFDQSEYLWEKDRDNFVHSFNEPLHGNIRKGNLWQKGMKDASLEEKANVKRRKRRRIKRRSKLKASGHLKKVQPARSKFAQSENVGESRQKNDQSLANNVEAEESSKDDYVPVPMEVEVEYEEIDCLEDNDDVHTLSQDNLEDSAPAPQEKDTVYEGQSTSKDTTAVTMAKLDQPATTYPDWAKDVKNVDEEVYDDLFLREQLLQALATKRAGKAKAIIGDQQTRSLPSPSRSVVTYSTAEMKKESAPKREPLVKNQTSPLSPAVNRKTASSTIASEMRGKSLALSTDRLSREETLHNLVIQIGGDSDSDDDDDDLGNLCSKNGSLFGGAINEFIKEARNGTEVQAASQLSIPLDKKCDAQGASRAIRHSNDSLQANLERCIANASKRLASSRDEISKENDAIKLLYKKIAIRKARIDQQDTKIARLSRSLAAAENTKRLFNAECAEFNARIKLLSCRMELRTKKSRRLEEELQRARSIGSVASSKSQTFNGSKRMPESGDAPMGAVNSRNSDCDPSDARLLLMKQINKSIAKMKPVLSKDRIHIAPGLRKVRKKSAVAGTIMETIQANANTNTKTNTKKRMEIKDSSPSPSKTSLPKTKNSLQGEKVRLQKLERELRLKLDHMKKLSEERQPTTKTEPKRRTEGRKLGLKILKDDAKVSNIGLAKTEPSISYEGRLVADDKDHADGKGVNENVDAGDDEKKLSKEIGNDVGVVKNDGADGSLTSLFQDETKIKKIKQDQTHRESMIPTLNFFHPHSIMYFEEMEALDKEKAALEGIVMTSGRNKTCVNLPRSKDFSVYTSPLLMFRSYRLSPWFRMKEKKSISSSTFSHHINPMLALCPYDFTGKCLDENCARQHATKAFATIGDKLLIDLINYEPRLASIDSKDSIRARNQKMLGFIKKLKQKCASKINDDELAVLLTDEIRVFKKQRRRSKLQHVFNICFEMRKEYAHSEERPEQRVLFKSKIGIMEQERWRKDLSQEKVESQELRYFEEQYDIQNTLRKSVEEDPSDVQSWLLLAKQVRSDSKEHGTSSDYEDQVLNILSKALEVNPGKEELWTMYLDVYSKRCTSSELREMFLQAIDYCRSYTILWKCINLENHYNEKLELCLDVIYFLREETDRLPTEIKSHRLLETVLFIGQLELLRGRNDLVHALLRSVLGLETESDDTQLDVPVLINDFTLEDFVIVWLGYISALTFEKFPQILFDPACNGPSKVVQKMIGIFDWNKMVDKDRSKIRKLFEDGRKPLDDYCQAGKRNAEHLIPFYHNYIEFEIAAGNFDKAVEIACEIVEEHGQCPATSLMVVKVMAGNLDVLSPQTASELDRLVSLKTDECVYAYANYLLKTNTPDHAVRLLVDSVTRKFDFTDKWSDASLAIGFKAEAITLYRRLLDVATECDTGVKLPTKVVEIDERSRDCAFLWLNLCLLLELTGTASDTTIFGSGTEEAFETAVNNYTTRVNREILWLEYLAYTQRQLCRSAVKRESIKAMFEVATRCLACMPSSRSLPYQPSVYWNDYGFHNQVISKCLQYLPESDKVQYLKGHWKMMPTNALLALHLCYLALVDGNFEQARTIYGAVLEAFPRSYEMWRMAFAVELNSQKIREARWLYEEATRALPFTYTLWKDFLLFEIGHGKNAGQIQTRVMEIASKATSHGIFIVDIVRNLFK